METLEVRIVQRYFRKTKAHPEGAVGHHGDCDFFNIRVCTCGLHHDMRPAPPDFVADQYPLLYEELSDYEAARASLMHGSGKNGRHRKK